MATRDDDLRYTEDGESARAMLYQGFNDINVFVEDKNKEYEYEVILKKLLGNDYRIAAIFSANGKPGVKERYNEYGSSTNGIKNFYIVDGDFDRYIRQEEMVQHECFIYLKPYNIENHLIDEEAIILYVQGKKRLLHDAAKRLIDFPSWKSRIVQEAEKLFFLYCYVQYKGISIENVGRSPYLLIDEFGFEKENVYNDYKDEIEKYELLDEETLQLIRDRYTSFNGTDYYPLICGKFLFASLITYLRKTIQSTIKPDEFRWFLVSNMNPLSMEYVKHRIISPQI